MKPILLIAGMLGAGTAGAVALQHVDVDVHVNVPNFRVNVSMPDHPGPDSARVISLLAAMSATDPVTCEMIGDRVSNGWWGGEDWGVGQLSDARPEARAARDSLSGRVRDPGAIAALTAALSGDNACVRRTAAMMLGHSTVSDDAIRRLLDDQSPRIREAALVAAGHAERPALRERSEALLRDRDESVASMAAWSLGRLEDPASVGALAGALERGGTRLRTSAAWALGEIESPKAIPALRPALRDGQASVRAAAADALGDIESPDPAEDLERLVANDPDRRVRLEAIEALGDIEVPRSAGTLAKVLEGNDLELSIAAVEAIGNLDDLSEAPAQLVRAASAPDPALRHVVAHALAEIADPSTVPTLTRLLTDADREVRLAAVQGLGEIGAQEAAPALTKALADADPEIRRAAAEALGEIEESD